MKRIAIHSAPRSGSTWFGCLFDAHPNVCYKFQPLWSYRFKNFLNENSSQERILEFFDQLVTAEDDFLDQVAGKEKGSIPAFGKKDVTTVVYKEVRYHHLLPNMLEKDDELTLIGLIRNPIEVLNSWLNAPREFRKDLGWKIEDEWLEAPSKNLGKPEEYNGYLKWKELSELFLKLNATYPDRVRLVCYSDLVSDPMKMTKELYDWCGLSLDPQVENFIGESRTEHNADEYSVFRAKVGDGQSLQLPVEAIEYIASDLRGTPLEKFL